MYDSDPLSEVLHTPIPENYFMKWFNDFYWVLNHVTINFYRNSNFKYISDFISNDTIKEWNHTTPVFISAQTGSGKSFFIQNVLLDMLVDEDPKQKNAVLLLSNRIALNRQFKIQLADTLVSLTGDVEYKKVMEQCYTFEGVDKFCYQFGIITACSYHQLLENHAINLSQFKYIVCDECHFFTSDSLFNPNTNEILKKIVREGNSAVRIYMSATPEIAFQPIIWAELNFFDRLISEFKRDMKAYEHSQKFRNLQFCRTQFEGLPPINIDSEIENTLINDPNYKRTILFYYLDRDYNYLENIFAYKDFEELINCIEQSKEKWLIFVQSLNEGDRLYDLLQARSISSVFISRKSVETDPAAKKEYDFIIEHEALNSRAVISTSILDNGINIKNEAIAEFQNKTLNIVINSFDRIQFIQMLGRIRVNPNDNISLFIRKYSIGELKNLLRRDIMILLHILRNDMLSLPGKKELFDKRYFRYTDSPEIFSEYNPCAVYQLIDNIIFLLNTIRLNEPNFFIDFTNDDMRALKTKIYQYYRVGEGKNKPWSRYVFDILETPIGWNKRKIVQRKIHALWHPRIITINWLDANKHAKKFDSCLDDTICNYLNRELELNITDDPFDPSEPLSVQLKWIDKYFFDVLPITDFKTYSFYEPDYEEVSLEKNFEKYFISEDDINQHKVGGNENNQSRHVKKSFLELHGIPKDSQLEKYFSDKFFDSKPLHKSLGKEIDIEGKRYILRSFNDNSSKRKTYYIFVCSE